MTNPTPVAEFQAECVACQTGNQFPHEHWHYCEDFPCLAHVRLNLRFCPRRHTAGDVLRIDCRHQLDAAGYCRSCGMLVVEVA